MKPKKNKYKRLNLGKDLNHANKKINPIKIYVRYYKISE